jgi:hypothetical protein
MMGTSRRRFSEKTREPRWVQDWVDAELVERIEAIEAQIAILDVERADLESAFFEHIEAIEAQVEKLDNERDRLELDLHVQQELGEPAEQTLLTPEEPAPSDWLVRAPMPGRDLALLVTLVLIPWIVIAAIVWLLFG